MHSYRISHKCWDSHSTQQILGLQVAVCQSAQHPVFLWGFSNVPPTLGSHCGAGKRAQSIYSTLRSTPQDTDEEKLVLNHLLFKPACTWFLSERAQRPESRILYFISDLFYARRKWWENGFGSVWRGRAILFPGLSRVDPLGVLMFSPGEQGELQSHVVIHSRILTASSRGVQRGCTRRQEEKKKGKKKEGK